MMTTLWGTWKLASLLFSCAIFKHVENLSFIPVFVILQVVKTKSEISALREFLQWLKEQQGDKKAGIILVRYEGSQIVPALLIVALKR